MEKYFKSDFHLEKDEILESECAECGLIHLEEVFECENCGSNNLLDTTSHEDCQCKLCKIMIDMWEDAYRCIDNPYMLICEDCYSKLPEEERRIDYES